MKFLTERRSWPARRLWLGGAGLLMGLAGMAVVAPQAGSAPTPAQPGRVACARNDGERLLRLLLPRQTCGAHESRVVLSGAGGADDGGTTPPEGVRKQADGTARRLYATATCPTGKTVSGGGFEAFNDNQSGGNPPVVLDYSRPTSRLDGWDVSAHLDGDFSGRWVLFAYAVCAQF